MQLLTYRLLMNINSPGFKGTTDTDILSRMGKKQVMSLNGVSGIRMNVWLYEWWIDTGKRGQKSRNNQ